MRLGQLILQLCALFIAGAIVVGVYAWYRNNEVRKFTEFLKSPTTAGAKIGDLLPTFLSAPSAVCRSSHSSFDRAWSSSLYVDSGRMRTIAVATSEGNAVVHRIIDNSGLYIWSEGDSSIVHMDIQIYKGLSVDALLNSDKYLDSILKFVECSVWWNPDDDVFRVPANLPIIEYEQ